MRRSGIIILNIFAALWAVLALHEAQQPWWEMLFPAFLSIGLINWAMVRTANDAKPDPEVRKRTMRVVAMASAAEGLLIFVAVNVLAYLHHTDLTIAVIAVIVGIHFWPLARGLKAPIYWTTGLVMVLVAIGCVLAITTQPLRDVAIAFGSAIILWLSACAIVLMPRKEV